MQFVNLKTLCFHNFYNGTDKMFHFSPNSYKYMKTYCDMITDNWDSYLLDTSSIYITLDTTFDHDTLEFVQSFIVQCIRCNIPHDMKFVDSDNDFWETMLSTISTERCIDVMKVADFMCFMFLYQACIKHFKRAIDEWDVEVICKLFSCTSTTPMYVLLCKITMSLSHTTLFQR